MAQSLVALYNSALSKLGASRLSDPNDQSREAELCNQFYPDVLDEVLMEYDWSCAVRTVLLAKLSVVGRRGFENVYQMPVEPKALRIIALRDEDGRDYGLKWQWVKDRSRLMTNAEPVYLEHVARVDAVSLIDPHVAEAIIYKLAASLAFPIMQSPQMQQTMTQLYVGAVLNAKEIEGRNKESAAEHSKLWTEVY